MSLTSPSPVYPREFRRFIAINPPSAIFEAPTRTNPSPENAESPWTRDGEVTFPPLSFSFFFLAPTLPTTTHTRLDGSLLRIFHFCPSSMPTSTSRARTPSPSPTLPTSRTRSNKLRPFVPTPIPFPLLPCKNGGKEGGTAIFLLGCVKPQWRPVHRTFPSPPCRPDDLDQAILRVEQCNGPILFISAGADQEWPSKEMCLQLVKRLEKHGPHKIKAAAAKRQPGPKLSWTHHCLEKCAHDICPPNLPSNTTAPSLQHPDDRLAHAQGEREAWRVIGEFLGLKY